MTNACTHDHIVRHEGAVVLKTRACPADDGSGINLIVGPAIELLPGNRIAPTIRLIAEGIAQAQGFASWSARTRAETDPRRRHAASVSRIAGRVLAGPAEGADVALWCERQRRDIDTLAAEAMSDDAMTACKILAVLRLHATGFDPNWDTFADRPWPEGERR